MLTSTHINISGAGLASVVISFLMSTYYAVIIAWAIYYFFTSFKSEVPWASCSNRWNTAQCWVPYHNLTKPNGSQTPTEQFFEWVSIYFNYQNAFTWGEFFGASCWLPLGDGLEIRSAVTPLNPEGVVQR